MKLPSIPLLKRLGYWLKLWYFSLFALALCVYIALAPNVSTSLYDILMFPYCQPYPSGAYQYVKLDGIEREDCFFPAKRGHTRLHGWFFQKPKAKYTFLIHHGQGGNLTSFLPFAWFCLKQGGSVFLYDYEGYGRSQGSPALANLCNDGEAAFDYLRRRGIQSNRIIDYGISLGTGVACNVAAHRPCAGVILFSPFASLLDVARQRLFWLNWYPQWCFPWKDIRSTDFVEHQHPPLLMFHGEKDHIIPVADADKLARSAVAPVKYWRLKRCGHVDFWKTAPVLTTLSFQEFLQELDKR